MQIIKVPGINGKKSRGCERAGNAILEELRSVQLNEFNKIIDADSLDLEEIHIDNKNLKLTNKLIYENSLETFELKPRVVFLGGDHSISYSILRAFLEYCQINNKEPCLIVFDSRPNCIENKEPTNESWLRWLVETGFAPENILLVGAKNYSSQESAFLKQKRIQSMNLNQLLEDIRDSCDTIMEFSSGKELYVSIDLSVVDSAFAPATAHSGPGGLTSRQLIYLIQRLNKVKGLRAVDIVEINAEEDKNFGRATVRLGAKIFGELI